MKSTGANNNIKTNCVIGLWPKATPVFDMQNRGVAYKHRCANTGVLII